jgi:hypothetical protein
MKVTKEQLKLARQVRKTTEKQHKKLSQWDRAWTCFRIVKESVPLIMHTGECIVCAENLSHLHYRLLTKLFRRMGFKVSAYVDSLEYGPITSIVVRA